MARVHVGAQPTELLDIRITQGLENVSIRLDVPVEMIRGEEYLLAAIISNSSESIDEHIGIPNIEVIFNIYYFDKNGIGDNISKFEVTNDVGVALISLSPSKTRSIDSVGAITVLVRINSSEITKALEQDDLPIVKDNDDTFLDALFDFLQRNVAFLTFLTIFFALTTLILFFRCTRTPIKETMWPKHEK